MSRITCDCVVLTLCCTGLPQIRETHGIRLKRFKAWKTWKYRCFPRKVMEIMEFENSGFLARSWKVMANGKIIYINC